MSDKKSGKDLSGWERI